MRLTPFFIKEEKTLVFTQNLIAEIYAQFSCKKTVRELQTLSYVCSVGTFYILSMGKE